jgi:ABC-2 type transport system permease protein
VDVLLTMFIKSLRDQRRALIGWALAVGVLMFFEAALWPSVRDMPSLDELMAGYPEAFKKAFNLTDFHTGRGFLNAELFSVMLPMLFIILGVGRGARAIAGDEEAGTLDAVLVSPASPPRLIAAEAAALAASQMVLGAVLWVSTYLCSLVFGLGVGPVDILVGAFAVTLMGTEFGLLSLAIGAMTGRRAVAIALTTVAAVTSYVVFLATQMVQSLHGWRVLSPFYQALHTGPLGGDVPVSIVWLPVVGVVAVGLAAVVFNRRDINT